MLCLVSAIFYFKNRSLAFKNSEEVPQTFSNISLLTVKVIQCEVAINKSFRLFLHTTAQMTVYATHCFVFGLLP